MGILGLLPLLKDIQVKTSVSSFKGQTVGVDAYCWLHKGTYGCAKDVVLGQPTKVYIQYVMRRVNMLINYNITPILVFDGGHLPAKSEKEKERREKRKEFRARALEALRNGNTQEAFESFQKCCDITPEMAANVIQTCSEINVMCIVAPYEADAQLAFLMKSGITQLTISEDSDLLLYGCNKVLYKMSAEGDGMLVDIDNLAKVRSVQLSSFTLDNFRQMCMLSGCDYLPSIKGLGLKKAHQALKRHSNIKQCIRSFKCNSQYSVPDDYEENFRKAELVFKYQLVFDPIHKCIVPLNIPEEELSIEDTIYCGPKLTDDLALNIALGNIDPISHRRLLNLRDFANGNFSSKSHSQKVGSEKSQGWLAASKENSKFQKKQAHKTCNLPSQANDYQESDAPFDLTPENCNSNQSKKAVKSLEGSFLRAESLNSEATKSLKRLRSPENSPTNEDKWAMLYEKEKVSTENQSVRTSHHSVFNVKKNLHKFKNPFRQDNYSSQHLTKSKYFSSNMQQSEPKNVEIVYENEKLVEPLLFEMNTGSQETKVKLKSTLNDEFQSISNPKQRKLEFVITPSLFEESSATPLDKNIDTFSDDNAISNDLYEQVNCESLSKIDSFDKSDTANLTFKNLNPNKIVSQPHITKMLSSFKRTESKQLVNESTDQSIMDVVDLTDEEPLSNFFKLQAEKLSLSSEKRPRALSALSRCKSVGLSRNKIKKAPQHLSKLNTSNMSKQTKITFDKFAFRRSSTVEKDALCAT